MLHNRCQILLIEDELEEIEYFCRLLSKAKSPSFKQGFETIVAQSLEKGLQKLAVNKIDVIFLDLMLTDSRGIKTLSAMLEAAPTLPIIVYTILDEAAGVKALELGAIGYLHKTEIDTNLLVYAIRSAIERQQHLNILKQQQTEQQQAEFEQLEAFGASASSNANLPGLESLRESQPDIFAELVHSYSEVMDLSLEEKAYKVEHNISDKLSALARQLGFMQATPRDVIEIHTTVIKDKTNHSRKSQAYAKEARLIILQLMGYLTAYYRKYFIGLNQINIDNTNRKLDTD
ncbi:response regulator with CheY-like receiver, AAA-type ATPase, and DNA-binding domains [Rivularia sp. PCC 7116]|uniref:response regulator n=1 Tax=Rivularia sp. PCC 7116 TaxID=373994 RepID=UPI00029F0785|nr:response regulator [Rivularia sp. PCC 7116]AFY57908.1 response regulator with CheY-like receiver, AAA-type ATPase, and DNA-binding domains [Rivularia sp. PCC 7116]